MVASKTLILPAAERFTHEEACRLAECAGQSSAQTVIIDLGRSQDASTAAFARIVLLRRELLQVGRDVRLAGLQNRAARLFEVHRLESILPRISELPAAFPAPRNPRRTPVERKHERPCALALHC